MKKVFIIVIILGAAAGGVFWWRQQSLRNAAGNTAAIAGQKEIKPMQITSSVFENNQNIPAKYTCEGDGVNPPLDFSNMPEGTASLALIMDDPDAPSGTWVHWTLWNIPADVSGIAENSVPAKALAGLTSSGQNAYGGPCPPSGIHHYHFKLYALDDKLSLPTYSEKAALEQAMSGHVLAQAELIGLYSKGAK